MSDQTFYLKRKELEGAGLPDLAKVIDGHAPRMSLDVSFTLEDDEEKRLQRGVICGCYGGEYWSVTARRTEHVVTNMERVEQEIRSVSRPLIQTSESHDLQKWPAGEVDEYHEQNEALVRLVWGLICKGHHNEEPRNGLIVIAGSTGSGKTTYARELARRCVVGRMGEGRPHVVTYEDPIESWFAYSPNEANRAGFEYTPRQKGFDVDKLKDGVADALRQKPALLYVGEVRSDDDWKALLSFAGTGHLAVTTTHAGSLARTFGGILAALQADTPADRSDISSRIIAVLHVREVYKKRVPALWVQTARSRTAFTQEGLASLLPTGEADGRYGRAYFAKVLEYGPDVEQDALQCDLRGE